MYIFVCFVPSTFDNAHEIDLGKASPSGCGMMHNDH